MAYADKKRFGRARNTQWRGKLPSDAMPPEALEFTPEEYEQLDDRVKIALKTVINKLPVPQRKKYVPLEHQREALQEQEALIHAGADRELVDAWLNYFAAPAQTGRAPSVLCQTLRTLHGLLQQFGARALNLAFGKNLAVTEAHKKCNPRYLTSILTNDAAQATPEPAGDTTPSASAPPTAGHAWERIVAVVERWVSPRNFDTWVRPLTVERITESALVVCCPDETSVYWLEEYYRPVFAEAFAQVMGHEPEHVTFIENTNKEEHNN